MKKAHFLIVISMFVFLVSNVNINAKEKHTKGNTYINVTCEDLLKNQFLYNYDEARNKEASILYYEYELLSGIKVHYSLSFVNGEGMIYTPNGSDSIYTTQFFTDLPDIVKDDINSRNFKKYGSDITLVSPATTIYNCHSYAWYMQNVSQNQYWLNFPNQYIDDSSYISSSPKENDILVYITRRTYSNNSYYDYISHSAIIQSIDNGFSVNDKTTLDKIHVLSKWGKGGLYMHSGNVCPYVEKTYIYDNGTCLYTEELIGLMTFHPRTNYTYTLTNSIDKNISSYLSGNGSITDKYAMYELNANNGLYKFSVSSDKQLDVRLYDEHMQLINLDLKNNGNTNSFIKYLNSGRYYFRVAYQDTNNSETISINIKHSHNYVAPYVWKNYTQHTATCECGDIHLEPHAVSADSFNHGQRYAPCLLCGGSASVGFIGPMSHKNLPTSPNGSYILPNGVIVLVDDDIELYLNGKLIFI